MGTRVLVNVFQGDRQLVCIYRQFDGYPDGMGKDLAKFFLDSKIINGIGGNDRQEHVDSFTQPFSGNGRRFNSVQCLGAQLVHYLKGSKIPEIPEVGNVYLYPAGTTDAGQEWVYNITVDENDEITIEVLDVWDGSVWFIGDVENFINMVS